MAARVSTFLMFEGKAEEAMNFYISLVKDAAVTSIRRYGPDEAGAEGSVMHASFTLDGQHFMCIDSNVKHAFTFTPATSIFIDCEDESEIDRLYGKLSENGTIFMALGQYPFSPKFGWVADKYGVSWQLNLPRA